MTFYKLGLVFLATMIVQPCFSATEEELEQAVQQFEPELRALSLEILKRIDSQNESLSNYLNRTGSDNYGPAGITLVYSLISRNQEDLQAMSDQLIELNTQLLQSTNAYDNLSTLTTFTANTKASLEGQLSYVEEENSQLGEHIGLLYTVTGFLAFLSAVLLVALLMSRRKLAQNKTA